MRTFLLLALTASSLAHAEFKAAFVDFQRALVEVEQHLKVEVERSIHTDMK